MSNYFANMRNIGNNNNNNNNINIQQKSSIDEIDNLLKNMNLNKIYYTPEERRKILIELFGSEYDEDM